MFELFKTKKSATPKDDNNYISFDDFVNMLINCSDEQFESIFSWLKIMREDNSK